MRRREFITLLGGVAAGWSLQARAQQTDRVRRVGVLMSTAVDDPEDHTRHAVFAQGLQELGWTIGRNLRIDYRWGAGSPDNTRKYAAELAALAPDLMLASGFVALAAVQQTSPAIPVVFVNVIDPVSGGFVESLARPGGNATGFVLFEYTTSGKLVELLKQIAPSVTRAAILSDMRTASGSGQLGAVQSAASQLGVEFRPVGVRDARQIERGITDFARVLASIENAPANIERAFEAFARAPNGGLILPPDTNTILHRDLIIRLAARHRLPAVYSDRLFVAAGGLMCYGTDRADQFRTASIYVDRIFRGAKPADLPVQVPTKYETVINLKTAKALGLPVPPALIVAADEVIE
jgi:putative tryptophan/tyrosine transport system substrate-binding protein